MKRDLKWQPEAWKRLAELWLSSDLRTRRGITAQIDSFERDCQRDPQGIGESRGPSIRVDASGPLGIEFKILVDGQVIRVTRVWLIARGGRT
jgi:hypothetical protein